MAGSRRRRTPLVHKAPRRSMGDKSDINVAPLVDVCLVLLIIFMVVTPMLARGMDVKLPETRHHAEKQDTGDQIIVSLTREGGRVRHYVDRDQMQDLAALQQRVEEELRRKPGQRIFIKADSELHFGQVYPALMAIHEAGSAGVELGSTDAKE
jgi:biopolymer transport protein TolR